MFSIAFSSLFGQDAVHRRPAHAESGRNRARRLTAGVHALRQSWLCFASSALGRPMCCPRTRRASRAAARRSRPSSSSSSARLASTPATMRPVALDVSMPSRSERNMILAVAQFANRRHDFCGIAAQAIYPDHDDCVTGSCVVKQRG